MKKLILLVIIIASTSCGGNTPDTATCSVCRFSTFTADYYDGEILLPDYVHTDTLIVTDATFINWCMLNYGIASDGDIADVLRVGTITINQSRKQ